MLEKSFVDENLNVVELAPLVPALPADYRAYVAKTSDAIMARNQTIVDKLSSAN